MTRSFILILAAALAAPAVGLSQDTTPQTGGSTPGTAQETPAATNPPDCEEDFRTRDADGNGFLTEAESPRDLARAELGDATIANEGLPRDLFLQLCTSEDWQETTPEAGAPFEGANSFTEAQARQRAIAWNVTELSPLTMDDLGIWRGTGKVGAEAVSVAIDYKGNVVTTPAAQ